MTTGWGEGYPSGAPGRPKSLWPGETPGAVRRESPGECAELSTTSKARDETPIASSSRSAHLPVRPSYMELTASSRKLPGSPGGRPGVGDVLRPPPLSTGIDDRGQPDNPLSGSFCLPLSGWCPVGVRFFGQRPRNKALRTIGHVRFACPTQLDGQPKPLGCPVVRFGPWGREREITQTPPPSWARAPREAWSRCRPCAPGPPAPWRSGPW